MGDNDIRPIGVEDWQVTPIKFGKFGNIVPLTGYELADGQGGNILHPAGDDAEFEATLLRSYTALKGLYPQVLASRYTVQMPYWTGEKLPTTDDYLFVERSRRLTTTSISLILIPRNCIQRAAMGFYFLEGVLPSLRERLQGGSFEGLVGNLGYYMTKDLISQKQVWSHNVRYPDFPLPAMPSYIGFHWHKDVATGQAGGGFQGAHPAAVAINQNGTLSILPDLSIQGYAVTIGAQSINVSAINQSDAVDEAVVLFTPALKTPAINAQIALCENSAGADNNWKRFTAFVPLADAGDRVHVFIANAGDGQRPVEQVVAVWEGKAPVPSFGAVLSFKRAYFDALFGGVAAFSQNYLNQPVQIVPKGGTHFDDYREVLGGFVPAVVNGEHPFCVETVSQVMQALSRYGNTTSPIAQAGKESKNFDPIVREPAGVLLQTATHIGWVLFDGRHELSIGASVVDVAMLLKKLEAGAMLAGEKIEQAVFVDGGSAMKTYVVKSETDSVVLGLLNRVAAGSRNHAGSDPDGLNLYSTLALAVAPS
jgi:hypothetical protein